ncbi:hypothetical protein HYC85_029505 [Camellia sinensis]|uniref:Uncharacterized protein n=1 Tax=Camellia sinensis TaxID=4442 RepID=A0A7J7G241_CAMSI|nr:hypothetical protein HYC85_029505 [Camellia sinensis]
MILIALSASIAKKERELEFTLSIAMVQIAPPASIVNKKRELGLTLSIAMDTGKRERQRQRQSSVVGN